MCSTVWYQVVRNVQNGYFVKFNKDEGKRKLSKNLSLRIEQNNNAVLFNSYGMGGDVRAQRVT